MKNAFNDDSMSWAIAGQAAVSKEKRRLRILGFLSLAMWILVGLGIILTVRSFFVFFYPILTEWALQVNEEGINGRVQAIPRFYMTATYVCAGLLGLASVATIVFVAESRRTTLRQIQNSLREISKEIKLLSERE